MTRDAPPAIRPAEEHDLALLTEMLGAFQEDARRHDGDLAPGAMVGTAEVARDMLATCRAREGVVLIAEVDGRPAGFAGCTMQADDISRRPGRRRTLELDDLYVAPEARRHGVGRALIEAVAEHGRRAGACRMVVTAYAANAEAAALYRDAGFGDHLVTLQRAL